MTEVHFLSRSAECGNGKEHECDTEEEVAYVALFLTIDEQQGYDVGSHDYGDGLCQC